SQAIVDSWNDLDVHAKRRQRSAVRVKNAEGEVAEFSSVKQAFLALELPLGAHIRFRMELKAAGKLEAFGMKWTNIPLNYYPSKAPGDWGQPPLAGGCDMFTTNRTNEELVADNRFSDDQER